MLEAMKAAVARAMEEGALGLSSALIYVPGLFASSDELVALARVAARYGGSHITHQRDEGAGGAIGLDASLPRPGRRPCQGTGEGQNGCEFRKAVRADVTFARDAGRKVVKAVHQQGNSTLDAPRLE